MKKTAQLIVDVPVGLKRKLKLKATREESSIHEYVLAGILLVLDKNRKEVQSIVGDVE